VFAIWTSVTSAQVTKQLTEVESLAAIKLATNPTSKLAAAEDFIARFPNSSARISIAELVAAELLKIKNGAVALALLERAHAVFTSEREREILKPVALEAYLIGGRFEDAFSLASELLNKDPENVNVLVRMAHAGIEESVKRNRKLAELGLQYALKAISIIENGNKPASVDDETWSTYKADLGYLYRNAAILYLAFQNTEQAKARSLKATQLMPLEPSHYAVLGMAADTEFTSESERYNTMPEGAAKLEARKKLDDLSDSVIDAFARAVGLATGRPQYQQMLQVLVPSLTNHYKNRHNQSTEGLQQLINRYRLLNP
jgi:tetratricopeptide (TPR) repeat protein